VHLTGYSDFDRRVTLVADNPRFALEYFGSLARRRAIVALLDAKLEVLWASKGTLHGLKKVARLRPAELEKIAGAVSQMKVLSDDLPDCSCGKKSPVWWWRNACSGVLLLLALLTSLYMCFSRDVIDFMDIALLSFYMSFPCAALVLILGAPFFLRMVPGRPLSAFADVVGSFVGLVFISAALLTGAIVALNCLGDDSAERVITAKIEGKVEAGLETLGIQSLAVDSWRVGNDVEIIRVDEEDYEISQKGIDCLSLLMRDGLLGFPWIQKYALVSGRLDPSCTPPESEVQVEITPGVSAAMNLSDDETEKLIDDQDLQNTFNEYYETVMKRVLEKWGWSDTEADLEVIAEGKLSAKGYLSAIKILEKSGNPKFDSEALRALRESSPLPKPPPSVAPLFAEIRFTFQSRMPNG